MKPLGALERDVLRLVVGQGMVWALAGMGIGLLAARVDPLRALKVE